MIYVDPVEAKVRMVRRGLNTTEIAKRFGTSRTTAYRILTGRRPVPPARFNTLLELLGPVRGLFRKDPPDA